MADSIKNRVSYLVNFSIQKLIYSAHTNTLNQGVLMKVLYDTVLTATYIKRPNRFVIEVSLNGKTELAHLPNPGRMWELLFPGVPLYLVPHTAPSAKTKYRIIGIERQQTPIMLDTNYSNDVADYLINTKQIPGWEDWHVLRREYTVGHSRFDLLLSNAKKEQFLVEVKSCTLFSQRGAMFPDAITERGRKHLLHLAALQEQGYKTGLLLLVQWDKAQWFLPDYHTDLAFAQTFQNVAPKLDWKALALTWTKDFTMPNVSHLCTYPKQILNREAHNAGDYLFIMKLANDKNLSIGHKGLMHFPSGYYIYIGSAKANLDKRLDHHKRKRKNKHWHLDYLRNECQVIAGLPIRTADDLECSLAQSVKKIADWEIKGFGCTDCHCSSHLFGMSNNPIHDKNFMQVVEDYRMNRLDRLIGI